MDINESVTTYIYENNPISFDNGEEVMINATEMAKPFGKKVAKWLELSSTREYLETLSDIRKSDITSLVVAHKGNSSNFNQGTWMQRNVALRFAQWLSPEFAIWCDDRVMELVSNRRPITLEAPKEEEKMIMVYTQKYGYLPVKERDTFENAKKIIKVYKKLIRITNSVYSHSTISFDDFVNKVINTIFLEKIWDSDEFLLECIRKYGFFYKNKSGNYVMSPEISASEKLTYVDGKLYISYTLQMEIIQSMLEDIEFSKE